MKNHIFAEYLNVQQVRDLLKLDLPQLKHAISKYELRLCAYIGNKKNPLQGLFSGEDQITLLEEKSTYILPSEIERIGNLSEIELQNEGYTITALNEPNKYLAKKSNIEFVITYEGNQKRIGLPPTNPIQISHDGYVELCNESFHNPAHSINGLFRGEEAEIFYVRCKRKNYVRHLNTFCSIKLEDIYLHKNEIAQLKNKPQKTKKNPKTQASKKPTD